MSDGIQRFFPGDALPAGIRLGFRAGPFHGVSQSFRMIDQFRAGKPFGAQAGKVGMVGILANFNQFAVFDMANRAAAGFALGIIGLNGFS